MNNFFFNPSGQMPPGLTKKPSSGPSIPQDPVYFQSSNLEKLNQFLNDPNMRQLLKDIINHTNGYNIMAPILTLQINTLTGAQYDLNQQGIMDIFSRFGKVVNVILKPEGGKAFIVFNEMSHALFAQKSLNCQYLPDIQANIRVEWVTNAEYEELFSIKKEDIQKKLIVQDNSNIIEKKKSVDKNNFDFGKEDPISNSTGEQTGNFKFQTSIPVKFTCRYEIQIENDKDFQVARKIIGSKGYNMKKIIDLCLKESSLEIPKNDSLDVVKLRLRGRGSGYKEGNVQEESKDPLHLCVSSKYSETFTIACKYVEELLRHIYDEYKGYCRKKGYKEIELQVKKLEMSQPNSLQGSFYSDQYFPQNAGIGENSISYNSSFLTASNNNSFNVNPRFNEFIPQYLNNDRFNRAAADLEGGFKNLSFNKTQGDEEFNRNDLKGKSQSFQGSLWQETEEERLRRKEKSLNAWKEKYGPLPKKPQE